MAYRPLEKLINLYDGYRRAIRSEQGELLLLQEQGQVYLIQRRCPHDGALLDEAPVARGCVTCPRHQRCYSLIDGQEQRTMGAPLRTLPLVYEGNSVGIDE